MFSDPNPEYTNPFSFRPLSLGAIGRACLDSYLRYDGFQLRQDLLAHELAGNGRTQSDEKVPLIVNAGEAAVKRHSRVLANMDEAWLSFACALRELDSYYGPSHMHIGRIAKTAIVQAVSETFGQNSTYHAQTCDFLGTYLEERFRNAADSHLAKNGGNKIKDSSKGLPLQPHMLVQNQFDFRNLSIGAFSGNAERFKSFMTTVDAARTISPIFFETSRSLVDQMYSKCSEVELVQERFGVLQIAAYSFINELAAYRERQAAFLFSPETIKDYSEIRKSKRITQDMKRKSGL